MSLSRIEPIRLKLRFKLVFHAYSTLIPLVLYAFHTPRIDTNPYFIMLIFLNFDVI
jgi:hypothetical protein